MAERYANRVAEGEIKVNLMDYTEFVEAGGRVCTDWPIGSRPSTSRRLSPHSTTHPQPFLARDECSTWAVFVRVWSFAVCGSARGRWAAGPVAGDEAGTEVDHLWPTFWDNCLQPWQWPP